MPSARALRIFLVVATAALPLSGARPARADDDELTASGGALKVPKLVEALRSAGSFKVRATAAVALGRLGDARAASALADALRSDDHYAVRVAAASALGRLPTPEGIPALLGALHDQDQFVREEAEGALDRFHTPANVYAFRDALQSEDAAARLAAVRAYGEVLRENGAVAPLVVNALGDDDNGVAKAAEAAISGIPHDRAVPLLVAALVNGDSEVRIACARLLTKRADRTAVEPLIALVVAGDEGDDVRSAAREALRAHRDYVDVAARHAAAVDTLPANRETRLVALRVLAALGDPGAPALVEGALKDGDPAVRVAGGRAAVDLGGDAGKKMLEAARAREADPRTQKQLELLIKSAR